MKTVSICITENNVRGLAPYIRSKVERIIGFAEKEDFYTLITLSSGLKNVLKFDKKDFRRVCDVLRVITDIVRVA